MMHTIWDDTIMLLCLTINFQGVIRGRIFFGGGGGGRGRGEGVGSLFKHPGNRMT